MRGDGAIRWHTAWIFVLAALLVACTFQVRAAQAAPSANAAPSAVALQAASVASDGARGLPFFDGLGDVPIPGIGMPVKVIDYARGYRSTLPARLKGAGVGIVVRYVGSSAWKCLTKSEVAGLRNSGIDIACVYETSAGWMLGGRSAGIAGAKRAKAAIIALGGPRRPFVYFACDVNTSRYATVNRCLAGAASVLGTDHVGVYGGYAVCDHALKSRVAGKAWQTQSWSYGRILPSASLYQLHTKAYGSIGGLSYDPNVMMADDIGQWDYYFRPADPSAYNPWKRDIKRGRAADPELGASG